LLIGIMSDTHDNVENTYKAIDVFVEKKVRHIIHLGDIISPFIPRFMKKRLDEREYSVNITAVLGNNDGDIHLLSKVFDQYGWRLFSTPTIIELNGRRFYLMHGYNTAEFTEKLAEALLRSLDVDGVLYGHTHRLRKEYMDGRLLLNPGEVCGYLTGKATVAVIDTSNLKTEILEL
jgi:putative phosphoesterase